MSAINFIQDLGIIRDEETSLENYPNLLQGQEFKRYEHMYINKIKPQLKGLESTGIPGIESIIETMENKESIQSIQTDTKKLTKDINKNYKKYITSIGKKEDSALLAQSKRTQYLMYIFVTISIIIIGIQTAISGNIGKGLYVIISLLIIIIFTNLLYNKV